MPLTETRPCHLCGQPFQSEGESVGAFARILWVTICDPCAQLEKTARAAMARDATPLEDRRRIEWIRQVGSRYATLRPEDLPPAIQPHLSRVLSWSPQPRGIGLLGPSRTGKSPLIYALAQRLYLAGVDVFPTSGIEFQRHVHRQVEHRHAWEHYLSRCEQSEVLLIDDADKLNLTPGVEAEYYGMLETRRNWQRPLLATLNLTGAQLTDLAQDRPDRAPAIAERLRDLCEFISVGMKAKDTPEDAIANTKTSAAAAA